MNRLLILAVPGDALSNITRQHQTRLSYWTGNRLAQKFPVHVTLRGPFWTSAEMHTLSECLQRVCRLYRPIPVLLNGPVFVDPDLCWLEVVRTSTGFADLLDLHRHLDEEMKRHLVIDDVPANHKGNNYRPHMTVGWGADAAIRDKVEPIWKPGKVTGVLEKAALAVYPEHWPVEGRVELVETVALGDV
ncbi:MAG: 2'-5' RNA ligase family protein [Syntrophobacteraceae bacterium]